MLSVVLSAVRLWGRTLSRLRPHVVGRSTGWKVTRRSRVPSRTGNGSTPHLRLGPCITLLWICQRLSDPRTYRRQTRSIYKLRVPPQRERQPFTSETPRIGDCEFRVRRTGVQIVPKRWSELVRCLEIRDPLACGVHTRRSWFTCSSHGFSGLLG
jgi:hypothetical protein